MSRQGIADIIDQRPPSGLQYRVFLLCSFVALMDGFDTQAIGYVAPLLASAIDTPVSSFGVIFSVGLAGAAFGAFAFGPIADRVGRRLPLIAACLIFAVFSFATIYVTSFNQLLVVRFVTGVGLGGAVPTCLSLVAEYAPARMRGLAVTAMFSSFPLGGFVGGLAASYLISSHGWQSVFILGGILPIGAGIALFFLLPESLKYLAAANGDRDAVHRIMRRIAPDLGPSDYLVVAAGPVSHNNPVGELFSNERAATTLLLWVPFFLGFMVILTVVLWGPALLAQGGIPLSVSALVFAAHYFGGFLGTAISGYLVDRFGPAKVLPAGFVAGALSLGIFSQLLAYPVALGINAFFCGLFVVGASNGLLAVAAALYPTQIRSTGIGWAMGVGRFGQLAGPVVVGWWLSQQNTQALVFIAASIACLVAAFFIGAATSRISRSALTARAKA